MKDQNGMGDDDIHRAAAQGKLSELQQLLNKQPESIEADGWFGQKPLHYAARSGSLSCVRYLLDNGADVNAPDMVNGTTAVFEASTAEIAELLIKRGANIAIISTKDRVPLDYAIQGLRDGVVSVLISHGADVNYKPPANCYKTMMQWAMAHSTANWFTDEHLMSAERIIEILLAAGVNVNEKNVHAGTALHDACQRGHVGIVRLLLRHGADPNLRDANKRSAFDEALGKPEILELLEPFRLEIPEIPKPKQSLEQLLQRLVLIDLVQEKDLMPCSHPDIAELENKHKLILPNSYKTFLKKMGRGAGDFLSSDHWSIFYDDLQDSNEFGGSINLENSPPVDLPDSYFVFANRLGDLHLFFVADGKNNDPPIFGWDDGGYKGQMFDSIWNFVEEMVEYYEFHSLDFSR